MVSFKRIRLLTIDDIKKSTIVPAEVLANLTKLTRNMNKFQLEWTDNMTVTSGYRTMEQHLAIYKKKGIIDPKMIPIRSKHLSGLAVDILDLNQELYTFCVSKTGLELLEECELWIEANTNKWVHFQCVPPSSGKRVFLP